MMRGAGVIWYCHCKCHIDVIMLFDIQEFSAALFLAFRVHGCRYRYDAKG